MGIFEILNEMGKLCNTHDIQFEVNDFGVIIRMYFNFCGLPQRFSQAFSFEIFKHLSLEDCVIEFERKLEDELSKIKNNRR